ncbi:restriction endonuclease subunit S [Acaryochloris sp. 'Moss Beach']|uniref:restriction endonuclease subunit S n=1 Tax=Acaryochloris sp. 'Moss Beach' TaxID=2740837 RepID=UPI001F375C90
MQNGVFYKPSLKGSGVRLINVGDLYKQTPISLESLELFNATDDEKERFKVKKGDLFFTRSSIVPSGIAHCNIYLSSHDEAVVFDSHVIRVRPDRELILPSYLFNFCISPIARKYLVAHAKTATMTTIDQGVLGKCPVLIPQPLEQEAIATTLSDTDALIESLEQLIAKKRHIKQGTMQELLTGKRRLDGFAQDWQELPLRDCLLSNPDYGINAAGVSHSGSLPIYLRITDIDDDGRLLKEGRVAVNHPQSSEYILNENEIVFARTGASVGKSYLYSTNDGELVFAGFLIRARIDTLKLYPDFLAAFTKTSRYWNWVRMMSMRSGQPGINGNEFGSLHLQLPTLTEQEAIATILSDMDTEIATLEAKLTKTRQLKQGMMHNLLTGRIRLI